MDTGDDDDVCYIIQTSWFLPRQNTKSCHFGNTRKATTVSRQPALPGTAARSTNWHRTPAKSTGCVEDSVCMAAWDLQLLLFEALNYTVYEHTYRRG